MKAVLLLAALSLAACSAPGSSAGSLPAGAVGAPRGASDLVGGAPPMARMQVALYDAPLPTAGVKVNIGLDGVQLLNSSGAVSFVTNAKPQIVNLLDLQKHPLNFSASAPGGQYTGVRLLIDSATSNVKIGGWTVPIIWGSPGHPSTAPIVAVDFPCSFSLNPFDQLVSGKAPQITLDFNVMQSVRFVNGTIYVQPSVTAANMAGQIEGTVENAGGKAVSNATVLAVNALGHVVNSTITDAKGAFVIHALPPGMYTVSVKNSYVTAAGETMTAANADAGAAPSAAVIVSPEDDVELDTLVD